MASCGAVQTYLSAATAAHYITIFGAAASCAIFEVPRSISNSKVLHKSILTCINVHNG
jgi:hypothetical protein